MHKEKEKDTEKEEVKVNTWLIFSMYSGLILCIFKIETLAFNQHGVFNHWSFHMICISEFLF